MKNETTITEYAINYRISGGTNLQSMHVVLAAAHVTDRLSCTVKPKY